MASESAYAVGTQHLNSQILQDFYRKLFRQHSRQHKFRERKKSDVPELFAESVYGTEIDIRSRLINGPKLDGPSLATSGSQVGLTSTQSDFVMFFAR